MNRPSRFPPLSQTTSITPLASDTFSQTALSVTPSQGDTFYPPESDQDLGETRGRLRRHPTKNDQPSFWSQTDQALLLDSIPRSVNLIRSRTMTSLQVKQVESLKLSDFTGREGGARPRDESP